VHLMAGTIFTSQDVILEEVTVEPLSCLPYPEQYMMMSVVSCFKLNDVIIFTSHVIVIVVTVTVIRYVLTSSIILCTYVRKSCYLLLRSQLIAYELYLFLPENDR
jgi:hypothetical protein